MNEQDFDSYLHIFGCEERTAMKIGLADYLRGDRARDYLQRLGR